MATIYEELLAAATTADPTFAAARHPAESETDYLVRICKAVGKLPNEIWEMLPQDAVDWFNTAGPIINGSSGRECPPCPGYQTNITDVTGESLPEKLPAKKAEPSTPPTKRGIMARIREIALQNPTMKQEQIAEQLKAEGWEKVNLETVWVCHSEVHNVLKAAKGIGLAFTQVTEPEMVPATVAGGSEG
jgi:hypothetical protein